VQRHSSIEEDVLATIELHDRRAILGRVTLRNSIDGWDTDVPGQRVRSGWEFDVSAPRYADGFDFKFYSEAQGWSTGPRFHAPPRPGGVAARADSVSFSTNRVSVVIPKRTLPGRLTILMSLLARARAVRLA
jgi:hypothetical protein